MTKKQIDKTLDVLAKNTKNPGKIYTKIFAFGRLGTSGLVEWTKTHKPGEAPEWEQKDLH